MNQALTYREKFTAEMTFGGVPCDTEWLRNSNLFKEGLKKFDSGEWKYFEKEVWKDIQGYEGYYQVSNHGRVMSMARTIVTTKGTKCEYQKRIKAPALDQKGYNRICLTKNSKPKTFKVHRLVADLFIGNPEQKPHVNHINGNKKDNHYSNLEWVTNRENVSHAVLSSSNRSSKYIGAKWDKERGKWVSSITLSGKNKFLGRFDTPEEASEAYKNALSLNGLENKYKN